MGTTKEEGTENNGSWVSAHEGQMQEWRQKYGELSIIHVGAYVAVVRKPNLKDFERALMAKNHKGSMPLDYQRSLLSGCGLHVDEELKDGAGLEMSLLLEIGGIAEVQEATVEKY